MEKEKEKEKKKRGKRGPYKKRKKGINQISEEINDICFPFKKGKEYFSVTKMEKYNKEEEIKEKYDEEKINEQKSNDMKEQLKKLNSMKFKIKRYYLDDKGKRKKKKKERKYKSDDIRKKIKAKFHKTLKNIINENLKKAGSKKFFSFLPQIFLGNVSREFNYKFFEYTYKELFSTNFQKFENKDKNNQLYNKIYSRNKETLEYLENNEEISKISGYYIIKNMKYKDILKAYFSSNQFDYSIIELKNKNETVDYIQEYIKISNNYINYYSSLNKVESKSELNEEIILNKTNDNNELGVIFTTDVDNFLDKDLDFFGKNFFDNYLY